jgi:hypothetical protein
MSESERETTSEKKPVVKQKPAVGQKSENFKEAVWRRINAVNIPLAVFVAVFSLAVLYFGAIESRVKELVRDPEFVAKVAQRVRPAIVFDADRRLLADAGAYKFLEGVPEVELSVKDHTVKSGLQIPYTSQEVSFAQKCRSPLRGSPLHAAHGHVCRRLYGAHRWGPPRGLAVALAICASNFVFYMFCFWRE